MSNQEFRLSCSSLWRSGARRDTSCMNTVVVILIHELERCWSQHFCDDCNLLSRGCSGIKSRDIEVIGYELIISYLY